MNNSAARLERWDFEKLFFSGDNYYQAIITAINEAQRTISFETYIFEDDAIGEMVFAALLAAHERGVEVRLLVDGLGSFNWIATIKSNKLPWVRTYHPLVLSLFRFRLWPNVNRRLHRKQTIVDGERAFVGSYNISTNHSEKHCLNKPAWQDVAVEVRGQGVQGLETLFLRTWRRAAPLSFKNPARWLNPNRLRPKKPLAAGTLVLFRSNSSLRERIYWRREIVRKLKAARNRVWFANPYFLPQRRILATLMSMPHWLRELKVIVPARSDVFMVRLASITLFTQLHRRGVQVFEYQPRFFHGKVMILDDWMTVGSTNLNHRSFLHDLEVDIVLTHPETRSQLVRHWHEWLKSSTPVDETRLKNLTLIEQLLGRFFVMFKWWL